MSDLKNLPPLNYSFPEAKGLLSSKYKLLKDVSGDCLVCLDTNVLLAPYDLDSDALPEIRATYKRLIDEKRLVIPGQVVREFARNRDRRLADLFKTISDQQSRPQEPLTSRAGFLLGIDAYKKVSELSAQILRLLSEFREQMASVRDTIRSWQANDPVSLIYQEFPDDTIVDIEIDDALLKEMQYRLDNKVPPGFQDSKKDDNAFGDILIWKSILNAGSSSKKSLVFVTGEQKNDWWTRSSGISLYPRFELLDEYRRASNGHTFHIISFPDFLGEFGVQQKVVDEARKIESDETARVSRQDPFNTEEKVYLRERVNIFLMQRNALMNEVLKIETELAALQANISRTYDSTENVSLPWVRANHAFRKEYDDLMNKKAFLHQEMIELDQRLAELSRLVGE